MKRTKAENRQRIHYRVRGKISGTSEVPRLAVFRSNKQIYVQAIDDVNGCTLSSASTLEKTFRDGEKTGADIGAAKVVGGYIAQRLLEKGIKRAVFDRGGYPYHGRVKAVADAAREAGLTI